MTFVETAEATPTKDVQMQWHATTTKAQDATMAHASSSTALVNAVVLLATAHCTLHKKWPTP
jgi:hypothetical protein